MGNITDLLENESGIQYGGFSEPDQDTEDYPVIGLMVGYFKRGRYDKPMAVTAENIRSLLGYQPKNPYYAAVQDALAANVESVQVLRIGDSKQSIVELEWGNWIINSSISVDIANARYAAYKTNGYSFFDSFAEIDLTQSIVRSFHDADMQQWQAVKDAISELTGVAEWTFDNSAKVVRYAVPSTPVTCAYETCPPTAEYIYNVSWYMFGEPILYGTTPEQGCYASGGTYFNPVRSKCSRPGEMYESRRILNPNYDPNATQPTADITFNVIAQKIISNTSSSNQGTALLAEAYLENVAKSILSADASKQFVKPEELDPIFEQNKTERL